MWELGLFSLEKRKLKRPLTAVSNYLVGGYREDVVRHALEVHNERTRDNSHRLQQEKFQLDMKKPLFFSYSESGSALEQGSREAVLRDTQNSTKQGPEQPDLTPKQEVGAETSRGPFLPKLSCDSMTSFLCDHFLTDVIFSILYKISHYCPLTNGFLRQRMRQIMYYLDGCAVAERLVDSEEGDADRELAARLGNLVLKSAGFY